MLMIDERSMLNSNLIGAAERNLRHCVFGQQNQIEQWGGIPVVLLFGGDYQLFPVQDGGAIKGYGVYSGLRDVNTTRKTSQEQILEEIGNELLIEDLTDKVFHLTDNYRIINSFSSISVPGRSKKNTKKWKRGTQNSKNKLVRRISYKRFFVESPMM